MNASLPLEDILQELENVVDSLSIQLRYEKGNFKSGGCKIKNKQFIFINKKSTIEQKLVLLATELGKLNLNNIYLLPVVREFIEEKSTIYSYS